jgi:aryl-alcohol dehydrogenase-like predicted oxidoreductase
LRRLGTGWIDLYQIHRWDHDTDQEAHSHALHSTRQMEV